MSYKLRILSLGAGVQSSALALMADNGVIARPDYAIFADTGWEPKATYDYLDWLEKQLSYPVIRVQHGNIRDDLINGIGQEKRFSSIPFFVEGGIGKRQCTMTYKIDPLQKKVRELLGFKARQKIPEGSVEMLIGISTDEASRMKPSPQKWIVNTYPLIFDLRMNRRERVKWIEGNGYPSPPKSACIGCPFHSNAMWRDMRENHPEEWEDACAVDEALRSGLTEGDKQEFMHPSRVPLRNARLGDDLTVDLFDNECLGMCGV